MAEAEAEAEAAGLHFTTFIKKLFGVFPTKLVTFIFSSYRPQPPMHTHNITIILRMATPFTTEPSRGQDLVRLSLPCDSSDADSSSKAKASSEGSKDVGNSECLKPQCITLHDNAICYNLQGNAHNDVRSFGWATNASTGIPGGGSLWVVWGVAIGIVVGFLARGLWGTLD
ncbi:hypothetical protein F4804DRAFT_348157 [Jackrogersella minutella]|nr:hypothetical protein F4804DRAFT_348157 [Jackrogersella minutella]